MLLDLDSVQTEDDEEMESFKTQLKEFVKERFETKPDQTAASVQDSDSRSKIVTIDVFNDKLYILATLLDPRCKTIPFEGMGNTGN